jgi:hypothetical protein
MPELGSNIPSVDLWLHKSNVWLARREAIMLHIDNSLQAYNRAPAGVSMQTTTLLAELYFSIDFWLKECQRGSKQTTSGRQEVVIELYKLVVDKLCQATMHTPNTLARWLVETYGKSMVGHGYHKDYEQRSAQYLDNKGVDKYRLEFKSGLAYQQAWWRNSMELEVVDTVANTAAAAVGKTMFPPEDGHQGYVLSMSRDFYMMQHNTPGAATIETGSFHSSYFAGEPVLCAGTLLVRAGKVIRVTTASGHYAPGISHLHNAVATLLMLGVEMKTLFGWVYGEPAMRSAAAILEDSSLNPGDASRAFVAERTVGLNYMRAAEIAAGERALRQVELDKVELVYAAMVVAHFKEPGHSRFKCEVCKKLDNSGTYAKYWALREK